KLLRVDAHSPGCIFDGAITPAIIIVLLTAGVGRTALPFVNRSQTIQRIVAVAILHEVTIDDLLTHQHVAIIVRAAATMCPCGAVVVDERTELTTPVVAEVRSANVTQLSTNVVMEFVVNGGISAELLTANPA